jgi:hypothetical protein
MNAWLAACRCLRPLRARVSLRALDQDEAGVPMLITTADHALLSEHFLAAAGATMAMWSPA